MGGSDQWGNIINGIELARRMDGAELYGLTTPLITTADGGKMGKTAAGAVWLNADRVSPYDYWQFWRNTQDADVVRFLKLFTDLPLEAIARLGALEGAGINEAKIALATATTALLHGAEAARTAEETAHRTFTEGGSDENLPSLATGGEIGIVAALVGLGYATSNGEARRKIGEGAVRLDGGVIRDPALMISVGETPVKLSLGKKKHGLLTRS
jgi:tyrosyl-tRNA synthetase